MFTIPNKVDTFLRASLALILLVCLFKMPYGYFQLVRFISCIIFVAFGLSVSKSKTSDLIKIIYFSLALLFQPLFKITLGRTIWNIVDVIVATGLIISIFYDYNYRNKMKQQNGE